MSSQPKVGCCYLVAQLCLTLLRPHGLQTVRHLCPWDSPDKNTGVGCHFLLQGDLPHTETKPEFPALADRFFTTEPPRMTKGWLGVYNVLVPGTKQSLHKTRNKVFTLKEHIISLRPQVHTPAAR